MRTWTVPNVITLVRIVLIFVFGALLLAEHDAWAIAVLGVAGVSDFLDGYLARKWKQTSDLGRILDPAADRILTVVVVLGLSFREIIPWWLVVFLLARDLVVGIALLIAKRRGRATPHVTFIGKAATFGLYVALPLSFMAFERWPTVHSLALILAVVAGLLYWWSGLGYVRVSLGSQDQGLPPLTSNT